MAPVAVPTAAIRNFGSHAKAVGLFGNPCCTVYKKKYTILIMLSIIKNIINIYFNI